MPPGKTFSQFPSCQKPPSPWYLAILVAPGWTHDQPLMILDEQRSEEAPRHIGPAQLWEVGVLRWHRTKPGIPWLSLVSGCQSSHTCAPAPSPCSHVPSHPCFLRGNKNVFWGWSMREAEGPRERQGGGAFRQWWHVTPSLVCWQPRPATTSCLNLMGREPC